MSKSFSTTQKMTLLALFIAIRVFGGAILTIKVTNTLNVSLIFIFIIIECLIFDYKWVLVSSFLGDILNTLIFDPSSFYFGYTLLAMFQTSIYYFFLHNKKLTLLRLTISKLTNNIVSNCILNPLLLSFLYNMKFKPLFISHLIKNIALLPLEVFIAFFILKYISKLLIHKGLVKKENFPFTLY